MELWVDTQRVPCAEKFSVRVRQRGPVPWPVSAPEHQRARLALVERAGVCGFLVENAVDGATLSQRRRDTRQRAFASEMASAFAGALVGGFVVGTALEVALAAALLDKDSVARAVPTGFGVEVEHGDCLNLCARFSSTSLSSS